MVYIWVLRLLAVVVFVHNEVVASSAGGLSGGRRRNVLFWRGRHCARAWPVQSLMRMKSAAPTRSTCRRLQAVVDGRVYL